MSNDIPSRPDRILTRRRKTILLPASSRVVCVSEVSAAEVDLLLDITKSGSISERLNELEPIFKPWFKEDEFEWPVCPEDFKAIVDCVADLTRFDGIISYKDSVSSSENVGEEELCADAKIFYMLDMISARYGMGTPFDLYRQLSYRQIIYCYAMAYNAKVDEITLEGGKGKDGKPIPKIYVKGLSADRTAMSEKDKMAHFAKLAMKLREEKHGRK